MNCSKYFALLVGVVFAAGCTGDDDRRTTADQERRATDIARDYLRAAADGDIRRVCALRTDGALRWWGGRAGCERRAHGIAPGPMRRTLSRRDRLEIRREALSFDPGAARVLPADTTIEGAQARVVADFGEAFIDDGHAVGGTIIEIDLKRAGGDYRVARVGLATFAD